MRQEKHFPTIIGLVLLVVAVIIGVFLTNKNANPVTKASADCQPINPQITNVSYDSVSVSFTTNGNCLANLQVNDFIVNDIRFTNTSTDSFESKIHYFDIPSLEENTDYNFTLIVGSKSFQDSSYSFRTAQKPKGSPSPSNLAWGKVLNSDKTPASEGIVYLNIPGASPLSSFITSSGNWNISLNTSLNEDLSDWFTSDQSLVEDIVVIASDQSQTQVSNSTTKNDPVEDIILGQNRFSPDSSQNDSQDLSYGIIPQVTVNPLEKELTINNPQEDETISSQKPEFFGDGPAGERLTIKIESPVVYTEEITINEDGTWNWSPPEDLTPGEHTITITSSDNTVLSHKFVVLAAEDEPSFSASGSAEIQTPTPSPTEIPTPTPTSMPSPTIKPTSTPTPFVVEPSPTVVQTTPGELPQTGNITPTFLLFFISLTSVAFAVFFLQKE